MAPARPVSVRRRRPALPGFFGRILCGWGSASPTCGTCERTSPARCHGEESVFPIGKQNLKKHGEHPPPPRRQPLPGRRAPGSRWRGRPGTHQLGVERRGEAVDSARVPDHPVEEIGHGQEVAAGVPRGADQQPQQRQRRGGTCGEPGGVGGREVSGGPPARPGPLRPAPFRAARRSHLPAPPPGPGPSRRRARCPLRSSAADIADVAPASPLYTGRGCARQGGDLPVMTGPSLTCAHHGHREQAARSGAPGSAGGSALRTGGAGLCPPPPWPTGPTRNRCPGLCDLPGSVVGLLPTRAAPARPSPWAERAASASAQKWRGHVCSRRME